jgi:adenylate cyclase class 2
MVGSWTNLQRTIMPTEIEAKMRVLDFSPTRVRLKELRATRQSRVIETNIIFDNADHSFSAAAQGLRVRQVRDPDTGNQLSSTLTYKGPPHPGPLKSREEIELKISDGPAAVELLGRLDMTPILTFEKLRESWQLDQCHIELDQVPHLGSFVEIEGPDEPQVMKVRDMLNLKDHPNIKSSYAGMLLSLLQKTANPERVIKFS